MPKSYRVWHEERKLRGMETKAKLNEKWRHGCKVLDARITITLVCPSAETGLILSTSVNRLRRHKCYTQRPKKPDIPFGWAYSFLVFPTQCSKKFAPILQLRDLKRKYAWENKKEGGGEANEGGEWVGVGNSPEAGRACGAEAQPYSSQITLLIPSRQLHPDTICSSPVHSGWPDLATLHKQCPESVGFLRKSN